jgi:hypothetical protein
MVFSFFLYSISVNTIEYLPLVVVDLGRIVLGTWFFFLGRMADGQHARHPDLLRDAQHLADRLLTLRPLVTAQENRPQPEPGGSDEDVLCPPATGW